MVRPVLGILTGGNYYAGDTSWHPDNRPPLVRAVKFTIYLGPLGATTGALRVISGSHREPFHGQMSPDTEATLGVRPDQVPASVFRSTPGDILGFNQNLWHAAFGGSTHRRMGFADFHEDPQAPEEELVIQRKLRPHYQNFVKLWGQRHHYPDYWRSLGSEHHWYRVQRLASLGLLDLPVAPGS